MLELSSERDKMNVDLKEMSQTTIQYENFDDALKFIVKSSEPLYQKVNHQKEFDMDYKYFEEIVEKAKEESFDHKLVKDFWEKEKKTSLEYFSNMNNFIVERVYSWKICIQIILKPNIY